MSPLDRRSSPADRIAIGIIRRAHGVRGEASVEPWTDDPSRFEQLDQVLLVSPEETEWEEARIVRARLHHQRVLVTFASIQTPEQVRAHQNWTIEIPASAARPLEEGEHFVHDLLGLQVVDSTGTGLGEIVDVIEGGGGLLLVVERADGTRWDLPFVRAICREIDLEQRRIVAELPEGLADLDRAETIESAPANATPDAPERQTSPSLRIDVVTIFPRMFDSWLQEGIMARALTTNRIDLRIRDLREFATDRHRSTDDEAYGGGAGMVMLAEPVFRCVDAIRSEAPSGAPPPRVVMLSPQGRPFDQSKASEFSQAGWLILLCGRYEGFDERIRQALVDEEISIGEFVVSGGEVPAMLVIDAVGRMVEGVVGCRNSVEADSFYNGLLDHPHYTRPAEIRGMRVPEVLLSGHAERIRRWRKKEALRATLEKRPDLLRKAELDAESEEMLGELREEREEAARDEPAH